MKAKPKAKPKAKTKSKPKMETVEELQGKITNKLDVYESIVDLQRRIIDKHKQLWKLFGT